MNTRKQVIVVALAALLLGRCAELGQVLAEADARDAARHEPQPLVVPDGMTEADVYAKAGAPTFSTTTADGGKILVYESVTTHTTPSVTIDTTPSTAVCVGNCKNVTIIPPRQSSVTVPGETKTEKKIFTFTNCTRRACPWNYAYRVVRSWVRRYGGLMTDA